MSSEIQELIGKLRKAEERRHAASLQAIDTLEENMIGSGGATAEASPAEGAGQAQKRRAEGNGKNRVAGDVSNVGRVLAALDTQTYRSLEEIMELTGLNEIQVRAALYARSLQSRVERTKDKKKRITFRMVTGPAPPKTKTGGPKAPSAADRVRDLLMQHPDGLRTRQIRQKLPDIKATTVGATLYNMKTKSKTVLHDEVAGIYRLK